MTYLSVCSGIEAASVAWHPLGWCPVAFAEVDASVEGYGTYEHDLRAVGVELEDWMDYDAETRYMKLTHALKQKA